jgi:hypothetical protein
MNLRDPRTKRDYMAGKIQHGPMARRPIELPADRSLTVR